MDEPGGVVEEEGFVFLLAEEGKGVVIILIERDAIFIEAEGIVFGGGGESGESVGFHLGGDADAGAGPIEALIFRLRKGVVIDGHMPFSSVAGGVAILT